MPPPELVVRPLRTDDRTGVAASARRGRELVCDAERAGVRSLMATVMRSNHAMLRLLHTLDRPLLHVSSGPVLQVNIQLSTGT